jgi:hypothetical protein
MAPSHYEFISDASHFAQLCRRDLRFLRQAQVKARGEMDRAWKLIGETNSFLREFKVPYEPAEPSILGPNHR